MPRNRKIFNNNAVHLITSRTEDGLPIVPNDFLNTIIWGILARAKTLYDIKVCHFVFMANHFHMLVVVNNPEHVDDFIGYIKCEIAHAINRLLGRRQKTIWVDGYDSPVLLTSDDIERYIEYIYLNPIKANLVENIKDYPGVSSWDMLSSGIHSIKHKKIKRPQLEVLDSPQVSLNKQKAINNKLLSIDNPEYEFTLEPFACFGDISEKEKESIKRRLISKIEAESKKLIDKRKKEKKRVIGVTALKRQSILEEYQATKYSKRMICISSDKELRIIFIEHFKTLCQKAKEIYQKWKEGDFTERIPAGLLSPLIPTFCSNLNF